MQFIKWQILDGKLPVNDIVHLRMIGQTTYLVSSTIWQPNVILICENNKQIEQLKRLREMLIKKLPWYLRLFVNTKQEPLYSTIANRYKVVEVI